MPLSKVRQGLTWETSSSFRQTLQDIDHGASYHWCDIQAASDLQSVRVGLARSARHGGLPRSIRLLGRGDPLQYPDRFAPFQKKGESPPRNGGNLLYKLL